MTEVLADSYLKADALAVNSIGIVLDGGTVRTAAETGFEDDIFELAVDINGIHFLWTMNRTSQRNLASKWGRDAQAWIGKKVRFEMVPGKAFGKNVTTIFGYPSD